MTSHAFSAFIDIEPSSNNNHEHIVPVPVAPQKAFPRTYHSVPDSLELENLQWGKKLNSPAATPSGTQTPITPSELEMSRPVTPKMDENEQDGAEIMQSFSNPPMNRFRMLSVCLMNFGNGLSDSAPGALIPYMERYEAAYVLLIFGADFSLDITALDMPLYLLFSLLMLSVLSPPLFFSTPYDPV